MKSKIAITALAISLLGIIAHEYLPEQSSSRCQAITKSTKQQCKRNAAAGSSYCWQHK